LGPASIAFSYRDAIACVYQDIIVLSYRETFGIQPNDDNAMKVTLQFFRWASSVTLSSILIHDDASIDCVRL
jgi:hypothetical protein